MTFKMLHRKKHDPKSDSRQAATPFRNSAPNRKSFSYDAPIVPEASYAVARRDASAEVDVDKVDALAQHGPSLQSPNAATPTARGISPRVISSSETVPVETSISEALDD